jgi:hypothetical protein
LMRLLAPGMKEFGYSSWQAADGTIVDYKSRDGRCCSHTYDVWGRDHGIPDAEKALTYYLWGKLYPKRFKKRPWNTGWGRG